MAERYAKIPVSDETTCQKKLSETQSCFKHDRDVVEFGCRTGTKAVHHAPSVRHIHAIDVADKMLEMGRGRVRAAGTNDITFMRGSLVELNALDDCVDVISGLNILHSGWTMNDSLIACLNGLKGFPDEINSEHPDTMFQLRTVHRVRNSMTLVP